MELEHRQIGKGGGPSSEQEPGDFILTTSFHVLESLDYKYCSVGMVFGGCSGHRFL